MSTEQSFVIVGNGIAGATAAEVLRAENQAADITVITDDPCPVFYRPALKDYLAGKLREEKLWARPISFYPDRQIRFLIGRVTSIQPGRHTVHMQNGQSIGYARLLLAHGARATSLNCPGVHLAGVTTLRTVADYQRVLLHLNHVKRALVIGSGTLALESIETLRHRGYAVTHLLRKRTLWSEILDPVASDLVLQQEQRDGVDIRAEQEIAEIIGQNGQVSGVITTTGQRIACELILLGIGIEPVTDFVKAAGILCGRGVKIDPAMHTNMPDIYAAGDLVESNDPITGKARVIGQWYPAIQQARAAAYSMLDIIDQHSTCNFGNFYNACMLYGLEFASVGISVKPRGDASYQEITAEPKARQYQKVILKQGVPVGMVALGDRRQVLAYKRAIDHQVDLRPVLSRLFTPDFQLEGWLDQQGTPSAILGVSREEARSVQRLAYARQSTDAPPLPPNRLQEARLVINKPGEVAASDGETYLSQTQVTTIGRQEGARLRIQHTSISRRHAEISYANKEYVLRDLGSSNGTTLNNYHLQPLSLALLKDGDQIQFGAILCTFYLQAVDPASSFLLGKKQPLGVPSTNTAVASKTLLLPALPVLIQSQPALNRDGSLMLPEARDPLPPEMVARLQQQAALVAIVHGQPQVTWITAGKRLTMGRDPQCEIHFADMSISRRHAELLSTMDGFYLRDLGSGNGVAVNHQRITTTYHLAHAERVTLGTLILYFFDYPTQNLQGHMLLQKKPFVQPAMSRNVPPETFATVSATPGSPCFQCGATLAAGARFCSICGTVQK